MLPDGKMQRYRTEGDTVLIELRLRTLRQLFDERDPAPFRERDLDDDAVDYLMGAVSEFPLRKNMKLLLRVADDPHPHDLGGQEMALAIQSHFEYEIELTRRKRKQLMRQGVKGALLAMLLLTVCLTAADQIGKQMAQSHARDLLKEGFTILGWVAWWRPMEAFLFDWWPFATRIKTLKKVANLPVEVVYE